jgi:hypothetical protein
MIPAYKLLQLKRRFAELSLDWPRFHLIAVRSSADLPNVFDDRFYLVNNDQLFQTDCTTNPGTYWLQNILPGKTGTAVLKADEQYIDCWEIGKHKGLHPALVQVRPVTVWRDFDKDLKSEEIGREDTGLFGINIHRANASWKSKLIDKWSAGCIVLPDPLMMDFVLDKCRDSGRKFFTLTLLKQWPDYLN